MKIIILGANGMLGHDLVGVLKNFAIYPFGKELDITKKSELSKKIKKINPDFLINAAAYTDVDGCESNFNVACDVNAEGVKNIAIACKKIKCNIIHISTDYVFDGKKEGYKEDDKPNPINAYGKSKLLGENYLKLIKPRHYIVRTSWLYGKHGKNFVNTILNLVKNNTEIEIVNDQKGSPTYTKDLSEGLKSIVEKKPHYGIYNLTNTGICTWFEFAKKIIHTKKLKTIVLPTASNKLKRAAKRPKCSVLINTKLPKLRKWEEALKDYLTKDL